MQQIPTEVTRRQIVEFEELVSRFRRINEASPVQTASLGSGLECAIDSGDPVGSTLSLDRRRRPPQQRQLSDLAVVKSLARLSRPVAKARLSEDSSEARANCEGKAQRLRADSSTEQVCIRERARQIFVFPRSLQLSSCLKTSNSWVLVFFFFFICEKY